MENKKRLIDAYKLEDLLRSNSARYHNKDDVIAAIAGQPTVDAVEVVRCKDCKYEKTCSILWESKEPKENGYCSLGERKDDGTA